MNFPAWSNMATPSTAVNVACQDSRGWLVDAGGSVYYFDSATTTWSLVHFFLFSLFHFFVDYYLLLTRDYYSQCWQQVIPSLVSQQVLMVLPWLSPTLTLPTCIAMVIGHLYV